MRFIRGDNLKTVFLALIATISLTARLSAQVPDSVGYLVQNDSLGKRDEPGPQGGGGVTTAYRYFVGIKNPQIAFRKRVLHPGSAIGYHPHTGMDAYDEIYYVLSGRGQATMDGKMFVVGPGDALLIRTGHSHGLKQSGGEDLVIIILRGFPAGTK